MKLTRSLLLAAAVSFVARFRVVGSLRMSLPRLAAGLPARNNACEAAAGPEVAIWTLVAFEDLTSSETSCSSHLGLSADGSPGNLNNAQYICTVVYMNR